MKKYVLNIIFLLTLGTFLLNFGFKDKLYNSINFSGIKDTKNVLENKSVLFAGDSITKADADKEFHDGWASRVGIMNFMKWKNVGVNGATIAKTKKHILDQIVDNKSAKYDYIILQGGINDFIHKSYNINLGEITTGFEVEKFDDSTFAGGLEELFYYTKKYYPNAKIGFIITYAVPKKKGTEDRRPQVALTKKICDKWNISYLDLYDGQVERNGKIISFRELLKVETGEYFRDKDPKDVHLNSIGYNIISKYISNWMKTL